MPTHIKIPAIGVNTHLITLGLNPDHTLEVPPYDRVDQAGWYRYSPTPGEVGPAVIAGHVNSMRYGRGVFYRLGDLRPGNRIRITRADRSTVTFTVHKVASFAKDRFPTRQVYGDLDHPGLRLITCGGKYNYATGHYLDNTVVFASMSRAGPANARR